MAEPVNPLSPIQNVIITCAESLAVLVPNARGKTVLLNTSTVKYEFGEVSIDDRLVDAVDPSLSCPLCLGPFRDATLVSPCGHAFCLPCLEQVMAGGGPSCPSGGGPCPTCRGRIVREYLTPALLQRSLVARLRVRCPSGVVRIDGANGSNKYALLEQPTGCDAEYPLEAHDAHMATCRFAQVFCKHCTFTSYRMNINEHEEKCTFMKVSCPAAWEGCPWSGCRKNLRKHLKKCTPPPVTHSKREMEARPRVAERRFEVGNYVFLKLKAGDRPQTGSLILRVVVVKPLGVLELEGVDGCTIVAHAKDCTPCPVSMVAHPGKS